MKSYFIRVEFREELDPDRFEEWCTANFNEGDKVQIFDSEANVRVYKW